MATPDNGLDKGHETPAAPLLRVVKGDPSPEELAALVAVVAAAAAGGAPPPAPRRSEWSAPHRLVRGPVRVGPGAWVASAR